MKLQYKWIWTIEWIEQTNTWVYLKLNAFTTVIESPEQVRITVQQDASEQNKPCGFFVLFLIQLT